MEGRRNNVQSPFDDDPYNFDHLLDEIKDQMVEGENYVFDKRGRLVRQGRKKYSQEGIIKLPKIPVGQSRPQSRSVLRPNYVPSVMANNRRNSVAAPVEMGYNTNTAETQTGIIENNVRAARCSQEVNGHRNGHYDDTRNNIQLAEENRDKHLQQHAQHRYISNGNSDSTRVHEHRAALLPESASNAPTQNTTRRSFQRVSDESFMSRDVRHTSSSNLANEFKHGDGKFQTTNIRDVERPCTSQVPGNGQSNNTIQPGRNKLGHYEGDNIEQRIPVTSFAPRPPGARYPRTRNTDPAYIPAPPTSKPGESQSYSKTKRRVKYRNQELDRDVSVHRTTVRESFRPSSPIYEAPEDIDEHVSQAVEMQKELKTLHARLGHLKKKCESNTDSSWTSESKNKDEVDAFLDELDDILEGPPLNNKMDCSKGVKNVHANIDDNSWKTTVTTQKHSRVQNEDDFENVDDFLEELDDILKTPPMTNKRRHRKSEAKEAEKFMTELDAMLKSPFADNDEANQKPKKDDTVDLLKDIDDLTYQPTQFRPNSVTAANINVTGCSTPMRMPVAAKVPSMTSEPLKQWNGETAKRGVGFKSKLRREEIKVRRPEDDIIPDRVRRRMDEYKTRKHI